MLSWAAYSTVILVLIPVLVEVPKAPLSMLMDIFDFFSIAAMQKKILLVVIDYFTKWMEAEALATITEAKVPNVVWKLIIYHFGLPWAIIIDNGHQFNNPKFTGFHNGLGISHKLTSVTHPQSNDETEVTNRTLLQGLKAHLE